ncbi:MAG: zinc-ribbon domain containing protein [Gammaproteobacteria bacterium]
MRKQDEPASVTADPTRWSEQSQRSVAFDFKRSYEDIRYKCWRCAREAVFTAAEQKHAYEVKKVNINQQRVLCSPCWQTSRKISAELVLCDDRWVASKALLRSDGAFLVRWLELLDELDSYVPYKSDTAKKNMLKNLLAGHVDVALPDATGTT